VKNILRFSFLPLLLRSGCTAAEREVTFPKTPFLAEVSPGRKLVEITITLANIPGSLETAAAVIRKHNVNILSGFHTTERWSFFADVTDTDVPSASLVDEVKALGTVNSIRATEVSRGFIIDLLHFPLSWGNGKPLVLMSGEVLGSIFSRVREIFGAEGAVGKVLVYEMGKAAGHSMFKIIKKALTDADIDAALSDLMSLYSAIGWGVFKLIKIDPDAATAALQVGDNFECAFHNGEGRSPYSQFIKGHLAALFSDVLNRNVSVLETECMAHGDPFCIFNLSPQA
jgi:predicted hydrocarbon binding protein